MIGTYDLPALPADGEPWTIETLDRLERWCSATRSVKQDVVGGVREDALRAVDAVRRNAEAALEQAWDDFARSAHSRPDPADVRLPLDLAALAWLASSAFVKQANAWIERLPLEPAERGRVGFETRADRARVAGKAAAISLLADQQAVRCRRAIQVLEQAEEQRVGEERADNYRRQVEAREAMAAEGGLAAR